jgi:transcriptional regulator with XRE-family HTH domain
LEVLMPSALGEKIRNLRKKNELTLEQLGAMTGSSKSYIWELENKNPPRPSAEKLQKIADALGVTVAFLIDPAENGDTPEKVFDEAFYRKYRKLDRDTKERVRQLVDIWSKGG